MNERLRDLIRMSDSSDIAPISPEALLRLPNPRPTEELPLDRLTTRASRLVMMRSADAGRVMLEPSETFRGAWELPPGARRAIGIPGRRSERLASAPNAERRLQTLRGSVAEPGIPEWLPIALNPTPSFSRAPPPPRRRGGRRLLRSDNHVQIFNGDSRVNIYPNSYPECCVCHVEVWTQDAPGGPWMYDKEGTGFMVGRRVMMSAGHMRPTEPFSGWMMRVTPAKYGAWSVFGPNFYTYASDCYWYDSDPGDDFMACRLYDAIGDTTGFFGTKVYKSKWEDLPVWRMCGYPFDIGSKKPAFESAISVIDDDDGDDITLPDGGEADTTQIETQADEASGASGSPLYSWFTNGGV